jgi:hypothetical protein
MYDRFRLGILTVALLEYTMCLLRLDAHAASGDTFSANTASEASDSCPDTDLESTSDFSDCFDDSLPHLNFFPKTYLFPSIKTANTLGAIMPLTMTHSKNLAEACSLLPHRCVQAVELEKSSTPAVLGVGVCFISVGRIAAYVRLTMTSMFADDRTVGLLCYWDYRNGTDYGH